MAKESKVQKVARRGSQGATVQVVGQCPSCNGDLVWMKVVRKMKKVCAVCGHGASDGA